MVRTRFALILYFRIVVHYNPYSVEGFPVISEDIVHILLKLGVLFTQDSEAENLSRGASSILNPACSSAIMSSA